MFFAYTMYFLKIMIKLANLEAKIRALRALKSKKFWGLFFFSRSSAFKKYRHDLEKMKITLYKAKNVLLTKVHFFIFQA